MTDTTVFDTAVFDTAVATDLAPPPAGVLRERWDQLSADRRHDLYSPSGARLYDRLTWGDPAEIAEITSLARVPGRGARRAKGTPVLELAAGSGRVTMALLAQGYRVTALDSSAEMLRLLEERYRGSRLARAAGSELALVCADMSDFDLPGRFDLIVLAATSVTLLDEAGRLDLFAAVRRHLAPGGRFVLSVLDAQADRSEPAKPWRLQVDGSTLEVLEFLDEAAGRRWTALLELDDDGVPRSGYFSCVHLVSTADVAALGARVGLRVTAELDLPTGGAGGADRGGGDRHGGGDRDGGHRLSVLSLEEAVARSEAGPFTEAGTR